MKHKKPCSKKIEWVCENCGHHNNQRGSNNSLRFQLLLKHARCGKCGKPRTAYKCLDHEQECNECFIPFDKKDLVGGTCRPCYMFKRRNNLKDQQPSD